MKSLLSYSAAFLIFAQLNFSTHVSAGPISPTISFPLSTILVLPMSEIPENQRFFRLAEIYNSKLFQRIMGMQFVGYTNDTTLYFGQVGLFDHRLKVTVEFPDRKTADLAFRLFENQRMKFWLILPDDQLAKLSQQDVNISGSFIDLQIGVDSSFRSEVLSLKDLLEKGTSGGIWFPARTWPEFCGERLRPTNLF